MHLSISPLAAQDLEDIVGQIAAANPPRALSFITELRAAIAKPADTFQKRPELGADIRSSVLGEYVLFFTASKTQLNIVCVLPAALDFHSQPVLP